MTLGYVVALIIFKRSTVVIKSKLSITNNKYVPYEGMQDFMKSLDINIRMYVTGN